MHLIIYYHTMDTNVSLDFISIRGISYYTMSICIFVQSMRKLSARVFNNCRVRKVVFVDAELFQFSQL